VSQSLVSQSLVSQSLVSQSLVSQSLVSESLVSQPLVLVLVSQALVPSSVPGRASTVLVYGHNSGYVHFYNYHGRISLLLAGSSHNLYACEWKYKLRHHDRKAWLYGLASKIFFRQRFNARFLSNHILATIFSSPILLYHVSPIEIYPVNLVSLSSNCCK
jgi:hypothetical protein